MLMQEAGTRAEDVEEEEISEEEEEETEEVKDGISRTSPASTVEEGDTRPPLARVPRCLEGIDEMRGEEMVKGENGKPLLQQMTNLRRPGWPWS